MRSLLTDEQMQQYEDEWRNAQDYKQSIIDGRWELESYTEKLKIADAIWSRYENTKDPNKKARTENEALDAYGYAIERLEELLSIDSAIEIYLDRPVRFEHGHEPGISACAVPRYKLSTSHHATPEQFPTRNDIKMIVIEGAIEDLSQAKKQPHATKKPAAVAQTLAKIRKHRRGA
jgi:hypothetical protein